MNSCHVSINNKTSSWSKVPLGIPQRSELGPLLFVNFFKWLPNLVDSNRYLFEDDSKNFNTIGQKEDKTQLQGDLNKLSQWSDTWQLKFNPNNSMTGNQTQNIHWNQQYFKKVTEEKDIGVNYWLWIKFQKTYEWIGK